LSKFFMLLLLLLSISLFDMNFNSEVNNNEKNVKYDIMYNKYNK